MLPVTLSVICPALTCRQGMTEILQQVTLQARNKPVELLVLSDNGGLSIGAKMNLLVGMASGDYIATIHDDDEVSPDYVSALLGGIGSGADVVTFKLEYMSGEHGSECRVIRRMEHPNAAVRASICREFTYPDVRGGEDSAFRKWLQRRDVSIMEIDRVLYLYHYRKHKAEFGGRLKLTDSLARQVV